MTPAPRPLRKGLARLAEPYVLFPIVAAVLLVVIWSTTLHMIAIERSGAERSAAASALEHGETYEAQVVRALREIDQTLKFVKYAYEVNDGRIDLSRLKQDGLLLPQLVFTVSLADAQGRIIASTHPGGPPEVGEREFFRTVRTADAIAISKPMLTDDIDAKLFFARRLVARNGGF